MKSSEKRFEFLLTACFNTAIDILIVDKICGFNALRAE
jgi:hypothetical protein